MLVTRETKLHAAVARMEPRYAHSYLAPSADVHRSPMNYNACVCATHVRIRPRGFSSLSLSPSLVSLILPVPFPVAPSLDPPVAATVRERGCLPGRDTDFRFAFDERRAAPCRNRRRFCRAITKSEATANLPVSFAFRVARIQ